MNADRSSETTLFLVIFAASCFILSESQEYYFENEIVNLVKYAENMKKEEPFQMLNHFVPAFSEIDPPIAVNDRSGENPIVQTSSGEVEGITADEAHVFYNIPYAEPPEGPLRFKSPVPLSNASLKIDATVNRKVECSQYTSSCHNISQCNRNIKEDCLILNIYVPLSVNLSQAATPTDEQLNVMLYIHGGSFLHGSSTRSSLESRWLSDVTNHIIVTINYRVGPWGFLAFDDGENIIYGKQGMEDQLLALKWVNTNIEAFGGNPDSVTIFGNSAGAQACMLHLVWDESEPYFHRVIMQSNPAVFPYPSSEEAHFITDKVIRFLGCNETEEYECLMNTPAHEINNLELRLQASALLEGDVWNMVEGFRPVMGFPDQPLALFRDGRWQSDKQVILGTNTNEVDQAQEVLKLLPKQLSYRVYQIVNNIFMGSSSLGEEVSLQYADWYANDTGFARAASEQMTHVFFNCPVRTLARFAAATTAANGKVFMYSFAHPREGEVCQNSSSVSCGYATHASEIKFVFRTGPYTGYPFSHDDYSVADQFSSYWGHFAQYGDPSPDVNSATIYDWQLYSPSNTNSVYENVIIDAPESVGQTEYLTEICDFWDSLNFYVEMPAKSTTKTPATTKAKTESLKTEKPNFTIKPDETTSGTIASTGLVPFSIVLSILSFYFVRV